jgi:hypothetical protein
MIQSILLPIAQATAGKAKGLDEILGGQATQCSLAFLCHPDLRAVLSFPKLVKVTPGQKPIDGEYDDTDTKI